MHSEDRRRTLIVLALLAPAWRAAFKQRGMRMLGWLAALLAAANLVVLPIGDDAGRPPLRIRKDAIGAGLAFGVAQAAITQVLARLAIRLFPSIGDTLRRILGHLGDVKPMNAALMTGLVIAPLEELFWRAGVQPSLDPEGGPWRRIAWSTAAYTGFQLTSGEPILAIPAAAGNVQWAAVAEYADDPLASIVTHATWSGLMLAAPPGGKPQDGRKG